MAKKLFGKRSVAILATLALLISMFAMVGAIAAGAEDYTPTRTMSITSAGGDVNSKMIITQSGTYLGAGKEVTVKGYYKIEDYAVVNPDQNPGVLIKGVNVGGVKG